MPISNIKIIPEDKHFGFIQGLGGDDDYFFHKQDYKGSWHELVQEYRNGGIVYLEFEVTETEKGLRANNVKRAREVPNGINRRQ